ncbi:MAG: P-type ATPase, translocating [Flavipsychrobacter sp.]|jgi:Cu+-exporting ATPase|nr:P-type ATPase, translocating [Flavipsychrobacter sp.]
MQAVSDITDTSLPKPTSSKQGTDCYHCGTPCATLAFSIDDKSFCCDGCRLVYEIINSNGLCNYYELQSHPGLSQLKAIRNDKYAYLDNEEIARQLYQFTDGHHAIVTLYIPGVHCSSCMWLLEHLNKIDKGITQSRLNFGSKEVTVHFSSRVITLRKIVELLCTIGYEPYISLDDAGKQKAKRFDRKKVFKLGIAGFCFGNIMMMSFPEYLSGLAGIEEQYAYLFRYMNLFLSIPVFFYCATEFFSTAWKGLMQRTLNIDAPIALAIIITFARSVYEIMTNTGAGYLDSMSGIVFFMLVGRVVQERTYQSLSFSRDYRSYFPIGVNVITPNGICSKKLQDLQKGDVVQLYNGEIIPADSMIIKGKALIDYSFVTGESEPVVIPVNETVYAGGKQVGEQITIQIVKPVAGSYLTSLWNHYAFSKNKHEKNDKESVIHVLSKYFTIILFSLAAVTAVYWYFNDAAKIINSVSAMLIVACPCALLLSATFTNGNILRVLSNNGLFLRDATVIEMLGKADHIVFDKTGTITQSQKGSSVQFSGDELTSTELNLLYAAVKHSKHPMSKAIAASLTDCRALPATYWKEIPGKGIDACINNVTILVGSTEFVGGYIDENDSERASVYIRINGKLAAVHFNSSLRTSTDNVMAKLGRKYALSLLSGDNDIQRTALERVFGKTSRLLFRQTPINKLKYVEALQKNNETVIMIGDGLNDAGALQQSDAGITIAEDVNNFTPSCDAILDASKFDLLPAMLKTAKSAKAVITTSFVISIIYNIIGLYFAMSGMMQPIIAAILMPCSTLSIVIISSGIGSVVARLYGLKLQPAAFLK